VPIGRRINGAEILIVYINFCYRKTNYMCHPERSDCHPVSNDAVPCQANCGDTAASTPG
jgi:hypothetical protein